MGTAPDHAGASRPLSGFEPFSEKDERPLRGLKHGGDKTLPAPAFLPLVNMSLLLVPAEEFPDYNQYPPLGPFVPGAYLC